MNDELDNINPGDQESRAIQARNARKKLRDEGDIRRVLDTVEGRRMIWKLLEKSGIAQISFVEDDPGGRKTAFKEGQRNIGNSVWQDILRVAPEKFTMMQRENVSDFKAEQAEIEKELKKMREENNNG